MSWTWVFSNLDLIWSLLQVHVMLSVLPILIGLALALPIGFAAFRYPKVYPPLLVASSVAYSIPSLALFVAFPAILGTGILDPVNVIAALTIYTLALLIRNVVDGLRATSDEVRQSAVSMGFPRWRQLLHPSGDGGDVQPSRGVVGVGGHGRGDHVVVTRRRRSCRRCRQRHGARGQQRADADPSARPGGEQGQSWRSGQ